MKFKPVSQHLAVELSLRVLTTQFYAAGIRTLRICIPTAMLELGQVQYKRVRSFIELSKGDDTTTLPAIACSY